MQNWNIPLSIVLMSFGRRKNWREIKYLFFLEKRRKSKVRGEKKNNTSYFHYFSIQKLCEVNCWSSVAA